MSKVRKLRQEILQLNPYASRMEWLRGVAATSHDDVRLMLLSNQKTDLANELAKVIEDTFSCTDEDRPMFKALLTGFLVGLEEELKSNWIAFKTADAKVHRSNLIRNAEEHPDRLENAGHGIWKVHPEFRSIYFK